MPISTDLVTKYGGTMTSPVSPITSNPITSKYGGTITQPTTAPTPNPVANFLGIQNPDTYFQDALSQVGNFIMHPIQGIGNAIGAAGGAISDAVGKAWEANKTAFGDLANNTSAIQKTADVLHSIGADAAVLFSPISAAFAAAEQVPVLKEAADVLNMPFAITGKIGDFAAEKFVDVLPIDQQSKDILKPAFGEIGSLAGQILLGGKIVSMVAKGVMPDKVAIDKAVADSKTESTIAQQHAQSPDMITAKYGGTITPAEPIKPAVPTEPTPKGATNDKYYIFNSQKYKYEIATGAKSIEIVPNVDTFIHKGLDGEWTITEAKTGGFAGKGKTVTAAKADALKNFENAKKNQGLSPEQVVDAQIKRTMAGTGKLSPRYETIPTETPTVIQPARMKELPQIIGELNSKSQLTDFYNKVVSKTEIPKPQEIMGTAPSGIAKSIEAKAIEQGLINKGFDKLAGYDPSTIKEQAKIFSDTINTKGIDEARAMLRGEKPLAEGQRSSSFIVGMEEYLKQHPDPELVYELANSPHTSAFSQAGSELGLGQNRVQDSFTAKVEEIRKAREAKTKTTPEKKATIAKRAKEAMNKVNLLPEELGKIEKFINENIC